MELTTTRGEVVLNGQWQFMPAAGALPAASDAAWGLAWVPGSWSANAKLLGVSRQGSGPAWTGFNGALLARGWYRRPLHIPVAWRGRSILLDLSLVSTDALVTVNGRPCGRLKWPSAVLDITDAVQPGQDADLLIDVCATSDEGAADRLLGAPAGPGPATDAAPLQTRGITGDVVLRSEPKGPRVTDLFVRTSTRLKQLSLDVELTGLRSAGSVDLEARVLDEKGKEEARFTKRVSTQAASSQAVTATWVWPNPRLWDLGQPNLYTLLLSVKGEALNDEVVQRFGFREFWIEGRHIFLNGTEFRMRPWTADAAGEWQEVGAYRPAIANQIDAGRALGFNIQEIWPENERERGWYQAWDQWYDIADTKGWPVIGKALSAMPFIRPGSTPGWAQLKGDYSREMRAELRKRRNHPSIVAWVLDANAYGYLSDQDPTRLGRSGGYDRESWWFKNATEPGIEAVAMVKEADPTRPAITHHGGSVGDMHTCNVYLDMTPLQEREEWLSAWAKDAPLPFVAIEMGTPLFTSFLRSRDGFSQSIVSEPWATEYEATYLGPQAYALETDEYRREIRDRYDVEHKQGDQSYRSWHGFPPLVFSPGMQAVESLFIASTWRSWRTLGSTGGMNPWEMANSFPKEERPAVPLPDFVPGTRGSHRTSMRPFALYGYSERGGVKRLDGAQALVANNGPTLAWICGPEAAVTAKDHHFLSGRPAEKQVALLNDTRGPLPYHVAWKVVVGGAAVAQGEAAGEVRPGTTTFAPISFTCPVLAGVAKQDASLEMQAELGEVTHKDRLDFRIYKTPDALKGTIAVFDPVGLTSPMLKALGLRITAWNGKPGPGLLVIGREALSKGHELPGDLRSFVGRGGRVLVMEQDPEWIRRAKGLRVARHAARRVYPVASHKGMAGVDSEDLRDWNGESTLLPRHEETPMEIRNGNPVYPRWGWHWGNRGVVSSAAIEKPHYGAWRPLLECEFDLAYSPLMELELGSGSLILCTLDLEDHAAQDPAAALTARLVLGYALSLKPKPRSAKTLYIGADTSLVDELGLVYEKAEKPDAKADLVVLGPGSVVTPSEMDAYLSQGGKALYLAARQPLEPWISPTKDFRGSREVPDWPECAGLSASDLHWRAPHDALTFRPSPVTGADGLLARRVLGKGVALYTQIDPDALEADRLTYFRFTRWRETRALSQLLTNLGARFRSDAAIASTSNRWLSLVGPWQARLTHAAPEGAADPGVTDEARKALAGGIEEAGWQQVQVPGPWSSYGEGWKSAG
ncbi:MAG TPA: beta-galactosidase, partial [Armatimonadota bacterium]